MKMNQTKSRLKAIDPKSAEPSKPKVLIFGKPGVGKTWTSLDFPAVYYIDSEGGADMSHYTDKLRASGGRYFGKEQGSQDFDTVIGQVEGLATETHEFKTLVIDSISKLYNIAAADAAERGGDEFGRDKKEANKPMRRLLNWLNRVDMNVILIAHEKPLWGGSGTDRSVIGETFDCWDKLEYELHLCLQIQKLGTARKAKVKKSRLTGFPDADSFDWSFPEFSKRYGPDVIGRPTKAIVLAAPEQVQEVKRLVELLKISADDIGKAFTKYGVSAFEEMDSETIEKVLTSLRAKLK
jgi:hypothetical protein